MIWWMCSFSFTWSHNNEHICVHKLFPSKWMKKLCVETLQTQSNQTKTVLCRCASAHNEMDFRWSKKHKQIHLLLTRSSSRIISAIPGLISQSSALAFGRSEAIAIGSIEPAAERNAGTHFALLMSGGERKGENKSNEINQFQFHYFRAEQL